MKPGIIGLLVIFTFLSGWSAGGDSDWPKWRGTSSTGISDETDWDPARLGKPKAVLWKKNIGKGHSAVSVLGDRLVTMGDRTINVGNEKKYEEVVYCLNARTGKEHWRYTYPYAFRRFPGPASTPTIDGDRVYTMGREGDVHCFDLTSGKVLWKRNLVRENMARPPQWGFCSSPIVEGDIVLLNAGKSGIGLNKLNGKTVWASEPRTGWLPTPFLFTQKGKRLAALAANGNLYALDPLTGKIFWTYRWQSDADPTVLGDKIYLLGGGRGSSNKLLDISNGAPEVVWETGNMANGFQSSVIIDGYAYGFGWMGRSQPLTCIEVKTGKIAWQENLGDWGALMAADGKLIILDGDGDLIVAKADPGKYTVISQAKLMKLKNWRSYGDDEPRCCWTAPVLSRGLVYARDTYGELVCVDLRRQ
jgi:outer membrane protein assembly factor BamB